MEAVWNNIKLLLQLYVHPQRAMSDIVDRGSWLFAAIVVLAVSFSFQYFINSKLNEAFGVPRFNFERYRAWNEAKDPPFGLSKEEFEESQYREAIENYQRGLRERRQLPIVGDYGLWFVSFNQSNFLTLLLALIIFYVPATILLITLFEPTGSFSVVLRRDYGALSVCALMAWAAAHLPFAILGFALRNIPAIDGSVFLLFWVASGLFFGVLMVFALRTIFGASYKSAIAAVSLSWISIGLGARIFSFVSPYLCSPFLLIFALLFLRSEAATLGGAFRQRQNFRRLLENATLNPHDSDAHVQLGLLYKQRRQTDKAVGHFERAIAIDSQEIDANYELGKIARENGDLPKALEHFSIVAEQNDKYAQSEIWREIGATYLAAGANTEAREFLEKFVERRPFDPEGLYYLGNTLKNLNLNDQAREMFQRCVEAVQTSPDYRRGQQRKWARLAQKQIA